MEVRHPVLAPESETAVDVYVDDRDGPIWIEVKFDKATSNTHFGNLINDICRLALIREGKSLMLYVAAEEIRRVESLDPRFLSTDPFCLDAAFFEKLHRDVKKRVNGRVAKKLEGTTTTVRLLAQRMDRSPACLLYEISTRP